MFLHMQVEEDGVPRKVVPDQSHRQSRSEASRDSRRPSNADVSEVVVKVLTSSKEPQTGTAQKPYSALITNPPYLVKPRQKQVGSRISAKILRTTHPTL
jgi:hypothetical protein